MDTDSAVAEAAAAAAPAKGPSPAAAAATDTMDTSDFGKTAAESLSVKRGVPLKRGSKTTKQRRRKAAKQAKAAAVGARRVVKHVKGKAKAGLRAVGK